MESPAKVDGDAHGRVDGFAVHAFNKSLSYYNAGLI
jgi:hypothetical protein